MSIFSRSNFPSSIATSTARSEKAPPGRPTPTFWPACRAWARPHCAPSSLSFRNSGASTGARSQPLSAWPPSIATAASNAAARPSPAAGRRSGPPSTWPRWSQAAPTPSSPRTIKNSEPTEKPPNKPSPPASASSSSSSTPSSETENRGASPLDHQDSRSIRSARSASGAAVRTVEGRQDGEDQRWSRQNPGAVAWRCGARQHRPGKEPGPDARQHQRAAQMGVPRSLRIRERRALRRQRQMRPDAAQRSGHESEAHRLRADARERAVHDSHRDADDRDAEPDGQEAEIFQADDLGQRSCDDAKYGPARKAPRGLHEQGSRKRSDNEHQDRQRRK